jgi:hypothetical protein
VCTDLNEIGRICELLAPSDNNEGNVHGESAELGVCKEIYRLHCLTRASKDMRFRDLASFVKGVLSNSTEPESLQLIAQRLRCTRMVVGDDRMRTTQMDIPLHWDPFVQPVTTRRPASGYTPSHSRIAVERQRGPHSTNTAPYLPSHLPALLVNIPSKALTSTYNLSQQECGEYVSRRSARRMKPGTVIVHNYPVGLDAVDQHPPGYHK